MFQMSDSTQPDVKVTSSCAWETTWALETTGSKKFALPILTLLLLLFWKLHFPAHMHPALLTFGWHCRIEKSTLCALEKIRPYSRGFRWSKGTVSRMLKARLIQHLLSWGQGSSLAENSFVAFSPLFVITFIALRLFLLCTHHCCRARYFLSPTGGWIYSFQWCHNIEQLVIVSHCLHSHTLLLCQP